MAKLLILGWTVETNVDFYHGGTGFSSRGVAVMQMAMQKSMIEQRHLV
jgi:hypothetical protein